MIKKIAIVVFFLLINFSASSHVSHYSDLNKLEFDLFRNNKFIGTHTYNFKKNNKKLEVESIINFSIEKLGIVLYKYYAKGLEVYDNDKLISFNSKTIQNKKEKFCKISKKENKYFIEGSSYKGFAPEDFIIGTWWNHSIIEKNAQISAISGRIINQKVTFLGEEEILVGNKKFIALRFNFSSDDNKLSKDKKLNTDVWYDKKNLIWLKASFDKKGFWEYRLKKLN